MNQKRDMKDSLFDTEKAFSINGDFSPDLVDHDKSAISRFLLFKFIQIRENETFRIYL